MTENRESATGKIRQSKGAATFFFLYFYFSLVYFIFLRSAGLYSPADGRAAQLIRING
jgi:hypothetical protein